LTDGLNFSCYCAAVAFGLVIFCQSEFQCLNAVYYNQQVSQSL